MYGRTDMGMTPITIYSHFAIGGYEKKQWPELLEDVIIKILMGSLDQNEEFNFSSKA